MYILNAIGVSLVLVYIVSWTNAFVLVTGNNQLTIWYWIYYLGEKFNA